MNFEKDGQVTGQVNTIISLIVGVGVASLILIFIGTLGGQTYNLVEDKIDAISDANIKTSVKSGITSGFEAIETSGEYLPLIVLAIVIFIVLGLVMGMGRTTQVYGGAL